MHLHRPFSCLWYLLLLCVRCQVDFSELLAKSKLLPPTPWWTNIFVLFFFMCIGRFARNMSDCPPQSSTGLKSHNNISPCVCVICSIPYVIGMHAHWVKCFVSIRCCLGLCRQGVLGGGGPCSYRRVRACIFSLTITVFDLLCIRWCNKRTLPFLINDAYNYSFEGHSYLIFLS